MREILFRGKRVDNGKWIEGYYCKVFDLYFIIDNNTRDFTVDPATVGQYTGLTDKNGTPVYEGDIIKATWKDKQYAKVIYESGMFKAHNMSLITWIFDGSYEAEVVGNSIDNPELLQN